MKSDDLFQLIKSLGKAEKRYFKRFAGLHVKGGQNKYVKLFNYLDKQTAYDESLAIKNLADKKFTRNFSQAKASLYKLILKSLRNYYHEQSDYIHVNDQLSDIELLYQKKQYRVALDKIERLAESNQLAERPELKISVNNYRLALITVTDQLPLTRKMASSYYETQKGFIAEVAKFNELRNLFINLFYLLRSVEFLNTPALAARGQELMQQLKEFKPDKNNILQMKFYIQASLFYAYLTDNGQEAYHQTKMLSEVMGRAARKNSKAYLDGYLFSLSNLMAATAKIGDKRRTLNLFAKIKQLCHIHIQYKNSRSLCSAYSNMISLSVIQGDFAKAEKYYHEGNQVIKKEDIELPARLTFEMTGLMACFASKKYSEAMDLINYFINEIYIRDSTTYYLGARILQAMTLYETGNYKLLKPICISTLRTLRKLKASDPSIEMFFGFMMKHFGKSAWSKVQETNLFQTLMNALLNLNHKHQNTIVHDVFILAWIESKSTGIPMDKILKKRLSKSRPG